jgi:hypothetical protein
LWGKTPFIPMIMLIFLARQAPSLTNLIRLYSTTRSNLLTPPIGATFGRAEFPSPEISPESEVNFPYVEGLFEIIESSGSTYKPW